MNTDGHGLLRGFAIAAAMMLVQEAHSGGGPPEYEVTAIIAGFQCGDHLAAVTPYALNEAGDVAGFVTCSLVQRAFRWTAETGLELIPMPPQTSESRASAINGSKVVGYHAVSGDEFGHLGFLYDFESGEFTSLGTLPGGNWSEAHGINALGQITGFWGNNVVGFWKAFIWENGEMIDIGPSIGEADSRALDINENGAITGWWRRKDGGERIAFVWEDGTVNSLGPIPGGLTSEGSALNDLRQVVGRGEIERGGEILIRAFLWENDQFVDLGTLPGFDRCAAIDIDNSTTIIGECDQSDNPKNDQLFVWSHGVMVNLNDLVPDNSDLNITAIAAINNCGKIAATAHSEDLNATVGILLSPIGQGLPGDLDNDGQVGVSDLLILLLNWGPCESCGNCPADLNGDCSVGVSDLLLLLANWGPCP